MNQINQESFWVLCKGCGAWQIQNTHNTHQQVCEVCQWHQFISSDELTASSSSATSVSPQSDQNNGASLRFCMHCECHSDGTIHTVGLFNDRLGDLCTNKKLISLLNQVVNQRATLKPKRVVHWRKLYQECMDLIQEHVLSHLRPFWLTDEPLSDFIPPIQAVGDFVLFRGDSISESIRCLMVW